MYIEKLKHSVSIVKVDMSDQEDLTVLANYFAVLSVPEQTPLKLQTVTQSPDFLKMYYFMFHFMSSLVTWDVVILVLIILKTHVWLST